MSNISSTIYSSPSAPELLLGAQSAHNRFKVVCRFRPIIDAEEKGGSRFVAKFANENSVSLGGKVYVFDKVLKPNATQENVYEEVGKSIIKDVFCGCNSTIIDYGQTSSGKTHTMEGVKGNADKQGIIPRAVQDIFNTCYSADDEIEFIVDLLDDTKVNLDIQEDKNRIPYVKGATYRLVSTPEEVFELIEEGNSNRHVAATSINQQSSRSHSILSITVRQENFLTEKKLSGRLYFVDLAGTGSISTTEAKGQNLAEAKHINKSLSSLRNVISAFREGAKSYIPYRESKLTRVLQECLGGNDLTTFILCCSPASFSMSETKSTLDFGIRVHTIRCAATEVWKRKNEHREVEKEQMDAVQENSDRGLRQLENEKKESVISAEEQQISLSKKTAVPPTLITPHKQLLPHNGMAALMNHDERSRLEKVFYSRHEEMDLKGEEMVQQSLEVEELKQQLMEQKEVIKTTSRDYEKLKQEMAKTQKENQAANNELNDVLEAMRELALSYDRNSILADAKAQECEELNKQLEQKQAQLKTTLSELQELRDVSTHQKMNTNEMLGPLLQDIYEIREVMGSPFLENVTVGKTLEETVTAARRLVVKTKSEVKNLAHKCQTLEATQTDCAKFNDMSIIQDKILGKGNFGEVREGIIDGKKVAVKILFSRSKDMKDAAEKELNILTRLNHKNVVRLLGIIDIDFLEQPKLIFEYVENGSLLNFVSCSARSQNTLMHLCYDITKGMSYLHDMQIIHCDLAARNVLVNSRERAKVADFGMSKFMDLDKSSQNYYYQLSPNKQLPFRWVPRESIQGLISGGTLQSQFSFSSDVWSFGVTMYEVWTCGAMPYRLNGNLIPDFAVWMHINDGKNPNSFDKPVNAPQAILNIMDEIFQVDKNLRPKFYHLRLKFEKLIGSKHHQRNRIQTNLVYLISNITNLKQILIHLRQQNIISNDDYETIAIEKTTSEKIYTLLTILERCDWGLILSTFIKILRSTGNEHCAEKIENNSDRR